MKTMLNLKLNLNSKFGCQHTICEPIFFLAIPRNRMIIFVSFSIIESSSMILVRRVELLRQLPLFLRELPVPVNHIMVCHIYASVIFPSSIHFC